MQAVAYFAPLQQTNKTEPPCRISLVYIQVFVKNLKKKKDFVTIL